MSYSYSSFGSLLSGAGMDALKAFQSNSKYMAGLKSVSTENSYTKTNKGFDTTSIFNVGTQGTTGSYTGLYNTSAGNLEKNFWSLVGSYITPATATDSGSATPSVNTNAITSTNNILSAASAKSVSDLISLLPKTSSSSNTTSGKMSSFFA